MIKRAQKRFEQKVLTRNSKVGGDLDTSFTRSCTVPISKDMCFFCDMPADRKCELHKVETENAGRALKEAVQNSGNEKLKVKLCTAINQDDAVAIDIQYHKRCWTTQVYHALRQNDLNKVKQATLLNVYAAEVEFLSLVQNELHRGKHIDMAALQNTYTDIRIQNNVHNPSCTRKTIRALLQQKIPGIEFHKRCKVTEPDFVIIKVARDVAFNIAAETTAFDDADMKCLFSAASILRKAVTKADQWAFTGTLSNGDHKHVPTHLYSFYRWLLQGPMTTISNENKSSVVNRNAMSLAQTTISMFLSDRQLQNTKTHVIRPCREVPQQLAVGIAIRQAIRSRKVINILHGLGLSVEYSRMLRVEAQIANTVLRTMQKYDNLYIPPDVVFGRHVFFAVDNVDFAEDTSDGKNTLHGTAMAIYQRCQPEDKARELVLSKSTHQRTMSEMPQVQLMECAKPSRLPTYHTHPTFSLLEKNTDDAALPELTWLVSRALVRSMALDVEHLVDNIPTWSGYHSLISKSLPLTRVGAPPLLAAPAHEWSTLLTILKQAQAINVAIMGPDRKTVISLDMGLYKPAKQLQMSRRDLDHLILRPGELHIIMAQLRSLGSYIENSGLDFCWTEADMYGPATVKQILEGKHVRRGIDAHIITLQALHTLYQDAFFEEYPDLKGRLTVAAEAIQQACCCAENIKDAHLKMRQELEHLYVSEKLLQFDDMHKGRPLFVIIRHYMKMVMEMLQFLRSVKSGDWCLHLTATQAFVKYFFAHDMLNYARMMPVYLSEMALLPQSNPDINREFTRGNWVVNKTHVPFCAIGADHALEHVNGSMKVSRGLIGITQNPHARTKFFLIAPELARLAIEAEEMAGYSRNSKVSHHALSPSAEVKHDTRISNLITLSLFTNPFSDGHMQLHSLVSMAVMSEKVTTDLCNQSVIGMQLFQDFVNERIKTDKQNLWAPMKKIKLQTWKTNSKSVNLSLESNKISLLVCCL